MSSCIVTMIFLARVAGYALDGYMDECLDMCLDLCMGMTWIGTWMSVWLTICIYLGWVSRCVFGRLYGCVLEECIVRYLDRYIDVTYLDLI